jgi:hypothetical protein
MNSPDLGETERVFSRWLHLDDPAPLYAVAGALAANVAPGDPVWLLVVGAPSTGKTEILSAASSLPYVIPVAKVTEAALLSGTPSRERSKSSTGGLLRQVGDFGILLCKDFTSVLAQNQDARNQALAALREVYDGRWDRPVGTEGARILTWKGKCGMIGGVTNEYDRHHQVIASLGDRFLLLRPTAPPPHITGRKALAHRGHEAQMRAELAEALGHLVASADIGIVNRDLAEDEQDELIRLARYTAAARAGVARDGYTRELLYHPAAEGPGRLITAFARMLGGMQAIGCDLPTCWRVLRLIAAHCVPAIRGRFAAELVRREEPAGTSDLAAAVGMATKNARPHLEDLSLLDLAIRNKRSDGLTAPDCWTATSTLRELWPESLHLNGSSHVNGASPATSTHTYPPLSESLLKEDSEVQGDIGLGTSAADLPPDQPRKEPQQAPRGRHARTPGEPA